MGMVLCWMETRFVLTKPPFRMFVHIYWRLHYTEKPPRGENEKNKISESKKPSKNLFDFRKTESSDFFTHLVQNS